MVQQKGGKRRRAKPAKELHDDGDNEQERDEGELPAGVPAQRQGSPHWLWWVAGVVVLVAVVIRASTASLGSTFGAKDSLSECVNSQTNAGVQIDQGNVAAAEAQMQMARQACGPAGVQQLATLERQLADLKRRTAEAKSDRASVKVTKEGYVATATAQKLDKVVQYAVANDKAGIDLLIQQDPDVTMLPPGLAVKVIERSASGYVRVRIEGTLQELWTTSSALRDE